MVPNPVMVALAGALVVALLPLAYHVWKKSRVTPEERERRRRAQLAAYGKLNDATLVEVRDNLLFYAYLVRGVEYTASQDVSRLGEYMPPDLSALTAVAVRYDPRNPANSIIVAEDWSGLRSGRPVPSPVLRPLE